MEPAIVAMVRMTIIAHLAPLQLQPYSQNKEMYKWGPATQFVLTLPIKLKTQVININFAKFVMKAV